MSLCVYVSLVRSSLALALFFLYNISGSLKWCVCVFVYLSLLRSFSYVALLCWRFFSLFIYIYFFSSFSSPDTLLCTMIDSIDRPNKRSISPFFFHLFFSVSRLMIIIIIKSQYARSNRGKKCCFANGSMMSTTCYVDTRI